MRMSILDRTRSRRGESDAEAVAGSVERAVRADRLGLHRFWVAEHHSVPGIASASPTVLLAAVGARTRAIRLGTGGIMLPNHNPLVVAEQVRLLEALHPGRVDVGIGASLAFTSAIRRALGRTVLRPDEYAQAVEDLKGYLHGERDGVVARPVVAPPPLFVLAVKNGLALAARLGLPAVIGGPLLRDPEAVAAYVRDFRPGPAVPEPFLMASVDIAVADSADRARGLLLPEIWALASSRETGGFDPLVTVEDARRALDTASPRVRAAVERGYRSVIAGTADQVAAEVASLAERTGADEVLATTSTFDRRDLAEADEALAALQDAR